MKEHQREIKIYHTISIIRT